MVYLWDVDHEPECLNARPRLFKVKQFHFV